MEVVIFYFLAVLFLALIAIFIFAQKKRIKEWMLWAVSKAEIYLGTGTGKIKLRFVYDMFISRFKFISVFMTFDRFSKMVDSALDSLKELMDKDIDVELLVRKDNEAEEIFEKHDL